MLCASLTPVARRVGWKLGLLDIPGGRKIHHSLIARSGGLAVLTATLVTFFSCLVLRGEISSQLVSVTPVLAVALIAGLVGTFDDLKPTRALFRLVVQALGVGAFLFFSRDMHIAYSQASGIPVELLFAGSAFVILAGINAFNLIDGTDGLAASVSAVTAIGLIIMFGGDGSIALLLAVVVGACVGFLPKNMTKSIREKIFLGDGGSMLLGAALSSAALLAVFGHTNAGIDATYDFILLVGLLGIPLVDEGVCVVRRLALKKIPGQADQSHLHHLLLLAHSKSGHASRRVLLHLVGLQLVIVASALLSVAFYEARWLIVAGIVVAGLSVYFRLGLLTPRFVKKGALVSRKLEALEPRDDVALSDVEVIDGFSTAFEVGGFTYARVVDSKQTLIDLLKTGSDQGSVRYLLPLLGRGNDVYLEIGMQKRLTRDIALASLFAPYIPVLQHPLAVMEENLASRPKKPRKDSHTDTSTRV